MTKRRDLREAGMTVVVQLVPLFVLVTILTAGWWLPPVEVSRWPLCFFKYLTHIDCPGCGLTRSFLSMARADLAGAFGYNAAGPPLYLFFTATFLERGAELIGRPWPWRWPKGVVAIFSALVVILLFGHWVMRVRAQNF